MSDFDSLLALGWQPYFSTQLTTEEAETLQPARVIEQHRCDAEVDNGADRLLIPLLYSSPKMAVGDWVLLSGPDKISRLLERKSLFTRKAAGTKIAPQLIAANVDVCFIVCSLNKDFNLNRIERYLSLAHEARVEPVIVLSKADLCDDPAPFIRDVQALDPQLAVLAVNCLEEESTQILHDWCTPGATVVLMGSSGSGKSTLTNTLMGEEIQDTWEIRENDAKGRHTTTRRTLFPMSSGALILDTPGMRELQLADCEAGVNATFADIEAISAECKFNDCNHDTEPGCAIREALETGELDPRRVKNYLKLMREQAHNRATLYERKSHEKAFGKKVRRAQEEARLKKPR
ncbi:ribosome small subunit-dependent GTPase A [Kiritimatiellaeota bacterium B1221]|nr:ribosome small subunit-dependent GTPase A [Kiritimatiellaeota bacterium B1221]